MKTVVVNAGPKRKGFNAQLMKEAQKGAESGADVTYIDLYKLDLHGCMSCMICKKEGNACKCYWRDEISPLIDEILSADAFLIGAPIFFTEPTSHYRALIERLIFCIVSYETGNAFKGKINVGLFYTINYEKDYFEDEIRPNLKYSEDILKMLNGELVIYSACNIRQNLYSTQDEEFLISKEDEFARDLQKAFEIGAKLSK